jgi:hypothetical protein
LPSSKASSIAAFAATGSILGRNIAERDELQTTYVFTNNPGLRRGDRGV